MYIVSFLYKEIRSDIETWSIDRVWVFSKEHFIKKVYRKHALKTSAIPLFNFGK